MTEATLLERATRIVEKLKLAKERKLQSFGSESHGFKSNPPLSEGEIAAFEKEHNLTLPEGYRTYLKVVGNGGGGPYYGIYPLSEAKDLIEWITDDAPSDVLSRPCPLDPSDLSAFENPSESDETWEKMSESFYGTLSLGTQGCTYMCQLVLNGPSRGRVLYCDADGAPPYFPPDADFLSWLERWLDELLEGRSTDSFGYGPIGSELSFCETLQNKARSDDERASALHGLWRFTTLSQASVNTLLPLRTHPDSSVRTLALALSNKHKFDDHLAFDQRALDDDSKKVRHDAYRRLLKTNAAEIRAKALSALYTKSDAEIAFTIYYALVKEDLLSQQDLEKLLAHKDQAIVKDVIPRFEFDGQHESTLLHLSQSDDEQIRLRACKTLTALKTPQAFAALLGTLKSATLDTLERLITLLGTFSTKDVSERLLNAAESQVRPVPALQV